MIGPDALVPADVPHWREVRYPGGQGWVNLNAAGASSAMRTSCSGAPGSSSMTTSMATAVVNQRAKQVDRKIPPAVIWRLARRTRTPLQLLAVRACGSSARYASFP